MSATFLVELGTEELPPKALRQLSAAFKAEVMQGLTQAQLDYTEVLEYATPRRLALKVLGLTTQQPDKSVEKRGPAIAQAFDAQGNPTPAAQGWAKGCGITVAQAGRVKTDKGEWLLYESVVPGRPATALLPDIVAHALSKLPIPKTMRWGDNSIHFVRPVHTLTLLLDEAVVPGTILGLTSGREVLGHRFMGQARIELRHADDYPARLATEGKVIADFAERQQKITEQALAAAAKLQAKVDLAPALLDEVTALVEWPVVLTASFEEHFLTVPPEALVHTMKGDQKYFPVYSEAGELLNHFLFVTNIESKDPAQIIAGNEKVVRPRLADAQFFFTTDRKQKLEDFLPRLEQVLFQQQLGTVGDKTRRLASLAGKIATLLQADVSLAQRGALLSKCDLMSNLVSEFPETQGVMGMHYARLDGEHPLVSAAITEHYLPRFAGDRLPTSLEACAVALADKLDTLVGIMGIGLQPKGDKDPFALRRAAIGLLRIVVDKQLPLDLVELAQLAATEYGASLTNACVVDEVVDFVLARCRATYQDQGVSTDVIQAVLARRPTRPLDVAQRMEGVAAFKSLDAAVALAAADKRVNNLLAKVDHSAALVLDQDALQEPAEQALAARIVALEAELTAVFARGDYTMALTQLSTLRPLVDAFFDEVMIMVDDAAVRHNRLALLQRLRALFLQVADIALLQW